MVNQRSVPFAWNRPSAKVATGSCRRRAAPKALVLGSVDKFTRLAGLSDLGGFPPPPPFVTPGLTRGPAALDEARHSERKRDPGSSPG
ncbi:hypothetical protein SJA_C1-15450 [Sphingobium indicum UT26S]|uniref:Uncharacterized protein n=1 Tax=Sphingobium indicum (strain DSM 16413 / CCM 7287 / MTCC 6362 / UT26 / NBRC 101211 / UT26S) TaxID=452662 RepID=D4Z197_SPHIU|nr:hypothetical protein SJA_C1-15450 [Sphingobium indicum UT26S]